MLSRRVAVLLLVIFGIGCSRLPKVDQRTCIQLHSGHTRMGITVACRGTVKIIRTEGYDGAVALSTIRDDAQCEACQKDWDPLTAKYLGEW